MIAEIGGNHEGNYEYALKLLHDAVAGGADAVKFQTYTPDRIVSRVEDPERHRHFGRFALPLEQYVALAEACREQGVEFMSSLWDLEAVDALDPYINIHKVGSGDLTNVPMLERLARTGKPLCLATAMAHLREVREAVDFVLGVNPQLLAQRKLCVMHCVAMYGAPRDEYANLAAIETLRRALPEQVAIGYSDHSLGNTAVKIAACMGVEVIEAHFTDDPTREFRDHHFALTKETLGEFVEFCRRRAVLLGNGRKQPVREVETPQRIWAFRRAVYFNRAMLPGEVATAENLTTLRPCEGISALYYEQVLGQTLARPKKAFERLSWGDFEAAK